MKMEKRRIWIAEEKKNRAGRKTRMEGGEERKRPQQEEMDGREADQMVL